MILPYTTDRSGTRIGYGVVALMAAWVLAFALIWPSEQHLQETLLQDSLPEWSRQLSAAPVPSGEEVSEASPISPAYLDSLRARATAARSRLSPLSHYGLDPAQGRWMPGLVTHQFLHAGWIHLLGNLLFFFAFGVAMERRFGTPLFLGFHLAGGAVAGLCEVGSYAALHHGAWPPYPLVGASGAIAASMGAFLRCYPKADIQVVTWILKPRRGHLPAWIFLGSWFALEFLRSHFLGRHQSGGTAYMAHVAGFLFGFLLGPFLPASDEVREEEALIARPPRRSAGGGGGGLVLGDAAPTPPILAPTASGVFRASARPLIDQAWEAQRAGRPTAEVGDLFQRQFADWFRLSGPYLENLATEFEKIHDATPELGFESHALWEWGMKLSYTHPTIARLCLERALKAEPPLPQGLSDRAEATLLDLPERLSDTRQKIAPPPGLPPLRNPSSSRGIERG